MPKRKHADGMQIAGQDHPTGGKRFRIKKSSAVEVAEAIERLVPRDKLTAFNLIQKILVRIPGWQPALEYSEEKQETEAMEGAPESRCGRDLRGGHEALGTTVRACAAVPGTRTARTGCFGFCLGSGKDCRHRRRCSRAEGFDGGLLREGHVRQMWLGRGTAQRVNRLIASLELWAASRSHDAGKMVAAVESVRRYGLQHPLLQELTDDVEHIQKAHKRAEEQKRDEVREQLLERAAQLAPGNSDSLANLEHTIDRAERYGVEENLVLSVYSQLKMAKCEQELDEAMQLRSIRHLEIAIDQAAECGGVARVKVRAAERVLEEEHHIKKVLNYFRETLQLPGRKQRVLCCYEELCQTQLGRSEEGGFRTPVPVFRG